MSAYEGLVERCKAAATGRFNHSLDAAVCSILAEVFRTLETVTPEMDAAWDLPGWEIDETVVAKTFVAMLRASPLAPASPS